MAPLGEFGGSAVPVEFDNNAAVIEATTENLDNDHEPGVCAGVNSLGPDQVYLVTIPSNHRLTATVAPGVAGYDPGIF